MPEKGSHYLVLIIAAMLLLVSIPTVAEDGGDPTETVTPTAPSASVSEEEAYLPLIIGGSGSGAVTPTATPSPTTTLLPTATVTATATRPIPSHCYISQLKYSGREEYITIANPSEMAQEMTGWKIQSIIGDQWYHFPSGYMLGAGEQVHVTSGPDARSDPPAYLRWTGAYIWNNDGDRANLIDPLGQEIDTWGYGGY